VTCLEGSGSIIYAGGSFTEIGGALRNRVAGLVYTNGAAISWNPNSNGSVTDLRLYGTTMFAAGSFNNIGGAARKGVAELTFPSGTASAWNAGANDSVYDIEFGSSTIYCAGVFSLIGGQPRNTFAALDVATAVARDWNVQMGPPVDPPNPGTQGNYLVANGSRVYLCGIFNSVLNEPHAGLAAVSAFGTPVDAPEIPASSPSLTLCTPYPNPTREASRVEFSAPGGVPVSLEIFDLAGRRVRTLYKGEVLGVGLHVADFYRDSLASGVYFVRLDAGAHHASEKLILID
jgi:hypothetical protein